MKIGSLVIYVIVCLSVRLSVICTFLRKVIPVDTTFGRRIRTEDTMYAVDDIVLRMFNLERVGGFPYMK